AAVATLEGERTAPRPWERATVGARAVRVPRGRDPASVAAHGAARAVDVDREVLDHRPDASPLLPFDDVEALDERRDGAKGADVGRTQLAAAREVHGADA